MTKINTDEIYTTKEAQNLLKISKSTMSRLIKKGIIKSNKVGGQYRFLGAELLRQVLPKKTFQKVKDEYIKVKKWVKDE